MPILAGSAPDSTAAQMDDARNRLKALSDLTNAFILRRSNALLSKVLPDKIVSVSSPFGQGQ